LTVVEEVLLMRNKGINEKSCSPDKHMRCSLVNAKRVRLRQMIWTLCIQSVKITTTPA